MFFQIVRAIDDADRAIAPVRFRTVGRALSVEVVFFITPWKPFLRTADHIDEIAG